MAASFLHKGTSLQTFDQEKSGGWRQNRAQLSNTAVKALKTLKAAILLSAKAQRLVQVVCTTTKCLWVVIFWQFQGRKGAFTLQTTSNVL